MLKTALKNKIYQTRKMMKRSPTFYDSYHSTYGKYFSKEESKENAKQDKHLFKFIYWFMPNRTVINRANNTTNYKFVILSKIK